MTKPIVVLNGPNLNLLGLREPEHYGRQTLADIHARLDNRAKELGVSVEFFQSNSEAELIGWIHDAGASAAALIINAGAFAHTSIAIRDAISAISIPTIDVHISNIYSREQFRHRNLIAGVARGSITGLGPLGYVLALEAVASFISETTT